MYDHHQLRILPLCDWTSIKFPQGPLTDAITKEKRRCIDTVNQQWNCQLSEDTWNSVCSQLGLEYERGASRTCLPK